MGDSIPDPKTKRATIADVARLSGVTKGTVSKALATSLRYGLRDEVRQRVAEVAQKLGYQPGGRRRSAQEGQARTIGLFYSVADPAINDKNGPMNTGYQRMISAAAGALLARQCRFIHLPLVGDPGTWKNLLEDWRVAGGLVIDPLDRALESLLRGVALRCVFLNIATDLPVAQAIPDFVAGAEALTRHLIEQGHRRITLCSGVKPAPNFSLREEGCRWVMKQAGFEDGTSVATDPTRLVEQWTKHRHQPLAVITDTTATAIQLLHACGSNSVRVPHDLSMASLEDAYPAELLNPPLTAMRFPAEQLAREAANLLVDQLEGELSSLPRKIMVAETLVVRGSTAAVARSG